MITATIDTYALNLETGFAFDLVIQSQLWNFDKLRGDYVPSISFPDTENNRAILNHPNRFETRRTGAKEYENFELRSDGYLLIRGTLVITDGFSGFVRGQVGNIASANADKLITDYTLPNGAFSNKTSFDPTVDDYCAPLVYNRNFFKDISKTIPYKQEDGSTYEETLLQLYHAARAYRVNERNGGIVYLPTDSVDVSEYDSTKRINVVSPMLFLFNAIKILLKENQFFLNVNDFADNSEIMSLLLYNNNSIVKLSATHKLNLGERRSSTPNIGDWAFRFYEQSMLPVFYKNMMPAVTLKNIVLGVQNLLNLVFVFNDDNRFDIVDRELIVTGTSVDLDDYFTNEWILGEKKNLVLVFKMNHDENDENFSTLYQDLSDRENDFGDDVETTSELQSISSPAIGELRRVTGENKIYEYAIETVTDINGIVSERTCWKFISIDFQPVKYNHTTGVDKETETIETSFSTCAYRVSPQIRQVGKMNLRKNSEAKFTPRAMFNISNVAKNNSTNYYLGFNGTNNLLEKRWLHTARFWANRQAVEGYFRFPLGVLTSIVKDNPDATIRGLNRTKYATRHGEFAIDKITTRFTHAGIGESKVEGWKIE